MRRGWVLRDEDHYLLGAAALQLSHSAARNSLIAVSRPVLVALSERTGMMANLQVLEADRSRVIDVVRPRRLEMITHLKDEMLPVHKFAGPLAMVALLDEEARRPYLRPAEDAGYPLSGPDGLLAEIEQTRHSGFALERGRAETLVASVSRAVASAKGWPICALTLVGLDAEFDEPRLSELKLQLEAATAQLQEALTSVAAESGPA